VLGVYLEIVSDGSVDSGEADSLIAAIRRAMEGAASPRRL
jgi:hypothetical protein